MNPHLFVGCTVQGSPLIVRFKSSISTSANPFHLSSKFPPYGASVSLVPKT